MTRAVNLANLADSSVLKLDGVNNRVGIGTTIPSAQFQVGTGVSVYGNSGIVSATKYFGDGSSLTGIDATVLKDSGGNIKVQANPSGAVITGVTTSTSFSGNGANLTGVIATDVGTLTNLNVSGVGTFGGNVSIGGTLTYEDVTNIDSVGVITARSGVRVNAGGLIVTAGVSTLAADLSIADKIIHTGDTNTAIRFPAADTFTVETAGSERLRIDSSGEVGIGTVLPGNALHVFKNGDGQTPVLFETSNATGKLRFYNDSNGWSIDSEGDLRFVGGRSGSGAPVSLHIKSAGAATFTAGLAEKYENAGTTLGSQPNNPLSDGNVILFTGNESGNKTINFTGVHSTLSNGETVSFTAILTPNNSGVINVVQVDGQAITVKWSGGSAPSAGASGQDVYTFQILKTGTGTSDYTVFGAATNYA